MEVGIYAVCLYPALWLLPPFSSQCSGLAWWPFRARSASGNIPTSKAYRGPYLCLPLARGISKGFSASSLLLPSFLYETKPSSVTPATVGRKKGERAGERKAPFLLKSWSPSSRRGSVEACAVDRPFQAGNSPRLHRLSGVTQPGLAPQQPEHEGGPRRKKARTRQTTREGQSPG